MADFLVPIEIGNDTEVGQLQQDLRAKEIVKNKILTGQVNKFGLVVTSTSKEPEAAVKFMNLFYQNEELCNLYYLGIVDEDYTLFDDGSVVVLDTRNYTCADFQAGNQFLMHPLQKNGADQRIIAKQMTEEAPRSEYLGFLFNTSDMPDRIAALSAVQSEYIPVLSAGGYSEATYNEFLSKLKVAGIDEYVAEAQRQLDAWVNQ